jgi:D-sedoheptulose 7-phosphate isomerase
LLFNKIKKGFDFMIDELILRYPVLAVCKDDIENAVALLCSAFKKSGKLLVAGNGGSASDSAHIVGELMKGFIFRRPLSDKEKELFDSFSDKDFLVKNLQGALPALSLTEASALSSAFSNDVCPDMVFAQQVWGLGVKGDVFLALSTSGNSKNVVLAAKVAKAKGLSVISLTGENPSQLLEISDITIRVPEKETFKVQELHLPVYHYICAQCEKYFFEER